jgi:integral membrane protein (TIGR01906 family)
MPLFIGCGWITLVIGPSYPRYEYGKPDFPTDLEGMPLATAVSLGLVPLTHAVRLELALLAVTFLESWQPAETTIVMLAEQQLPHIGTPLYNQRELNHLVDVKHITDAICWLAPLTAMPVIGGLLFLLRRPRTRRVSYLALGQGGLFTGILLSGIAGLILFGWSFFFYQFHGLLFPSGTWTFAATDSLMRLYPERFFFDVGVIISLGAWLCGMLAALAGYLLAWRAAITTSVTIRGTHVQKAVR